MAPIFDETTNLKADEPIICEVDGQRVLRLVTHLSGYKSDDVIVKPVDSKLLILTKDDVTLKSYDLPESLDPFTVEAQLGEDGVLRVEAPVQH
nr:small heat shock protein [Pareurythoe californica]